MLKEQVQDRLAVLKKEFEAGQARLRQLESDQAFLRETLLRISGAIQVLQEIVEEPKAQSGAEKEMDNPKVAS